MAQSSEPDDEGVDSKLVMDEGFDLGETGLWQPEDG